MIKSLGLFIPPLKEFDFAFEIVDFLVKLKAWIGTLSSLCIVVSVFVLSHGVFSHTEELLTVTAAFGLVEINSSERENFSKSSPVGFDTSIFDDQSSWLIIFGLFNNTRRFLRLYWHELESSCRNCQVLVVAI